MSSEAQAGTPGLGLSRPASAISRFHLSGLEIAAVLVALASIVGAAVYYFSTLGPERENLRSLEQRLAQQQDVLIQTAQPEQDVEVSAELQAKEALVTLDQFRVDYLSPLRKSQIALVDDINALSRKHSVELRNGIQMQAADPLSEGSDPETKKINDLLAVFPRMDVNITIVGPYASLRSFISELERNRQFLVIKSIDLALVDALDTASAGRATAARTGLALSLSMTAYFRP